MFTKIRRRVLLALVLAVGVLAPVHAQGESGPDFALEIHVDGQDLSTLSVLTLDVTRTSAIDLRVHDAKQDLTLRSITVAPAIAGREIVAFQKALTEAHVVSGQDFSTRMELSLGDYLSWDGRPLATGLYDVHVTVDYETASGGQRTYDLPLEVRVPGNPLATPPGIAAVLFGIAAIAAAFSLASSVTTPAIAFGMQLPATAQAYATNQFKDFSSGGLEPMARERSIALMTEAAKKRMKKDRCPMCGAHLKHDMCLPCGKPVEELRAEYVDSMKDLMVDFGDAFADNQVLSVGALSRELGITPHLATEFLAVARKAKLMGIKGIGARVGGKALMMSVNAGVSTVLIITVGGFARLTPTILAVIVVLTVAAPLAITRYVAWRARRASRLTPVSPVAAR